MSHPRHTPSAAHTRTRQRVLGLLCTVALAFGLAAALPMSAYAAAPAAAVPITAASTPDSSAPADALGAGTYRAVTRRVSGIGTPEIIGDAEVGDWLWADAGEWGGKYTDFDYQWLVDGDPVTGATSDEYRVRLRDLGSSVAVEVTGSGALRDPVTVSSAEIGPVTPGVLEPGRARFDHQPRAGRSVTVTAGKTPGIRAKVRYQWTVNGKNLRGATGKSLRLPRAFRGDKLAVRITYSAVGYKPTTVVVSMGRVR